MEYLDSENLPNEVLVPKISGVGYTMHDSP